MSTTKRNRASAIRDYFYLPGRLQTLEEAAQTLCMSRAHLLEECDDNAEPFNDTAVAYLPGGIVAIFDDWEDWKFRFPVKAATPSTEGA